MTTDLAAATERIRTWINGTGEAHQYLDGDRLQAADEAALIDAYLDETDPAPITEAALREMGWAEPIEGGKTWVRADQCALIMPGAHDYAGKWYFWSEHHDSTITTLGELRTLLRLCGEQPCE